MSVNIEFHIQKLFYIDDYRKTILVPVPGKTSAIYRCPLREVSLYVVNRHRLNSCSVEFVLLFRIFLFSKRIPFYYDGKLRSEHVTRAQSGFKPQVRWISRWFKRKLSGLVFLHPVFEIENVSNRYHATNYVHNAFLKRSTFGDEFFSNITICQLVLATWRRDDACLKNKIFLLTAGEPCWILILPVRKGRAKAPLKPGRRNRLSFGFRRTTHTRARAHTHDW